MPLVPCPDCQYLVQDLARWRCVKGDTSDMVGDFSCFRPKSMTHAVVLQHASCPRCLMQLENRGYKSLDPVVAECHGCGLRVIAKFWTSQEK